MSSSSSAGNRRGREGGEGDNKMTQKKSNNNNNNSTTKAAAASSGTNNKANDNTKNKYHQQNQNQKPQEELKPFNAKQFLAESAELTEDSIVLGIDEAGRGPALGDMVYGAAMVSLKQHQALVDTGVNDSKQLDEKARDRIREKCEKLALSPEGDSFRALVLPVTPETISESMLGKSGRTLNTLSHQAAIALIRQATFMCNGKLAAVFVDTVGPPITYQRLLKARFPHLIIKVTKKADSLFPVVGAASIFAKTDRDSGMKNNYVGQNVGSGYPSDERTMKFLNQGGLLNRFFSFTSTDVRQSWAPVVKITQGRCVPLRFEVDDEREGTSTNATTGAAAFSNGMRQPTFSFTKQPPKRDPVFSTLLGFQSVAAI